MNIFFFECKKSLAKYVIETDLNKYKAVPLVEVCFLDGGWCSFLFNFLFSVISAVCEKAEAGEEEGSFKKGT